ncbi:MAG: serine hydrolase domain-containing protein [Chloroflexota bacterium]
MSLLLRIAGGVIGILVILGVLGYVTLIPRPLSAPGSVTSQEELDAYLSELTGHNADSPPGLSLVVVKDGEIVYENAFGSADAVRNHPATTDTVYQYWSLTKPFTAVAILQLQEQGLLNINDTVSDYLPYFNVQYPSEGSETVTIRHLLNHSSGIRNNSPEVIGWIHFDGDNEWDQNMLFETKLPDYARLAYEPGSQGVYTNVGYLGLAAIIEAVSGQSYQDYMLEHIFGPLDMRNTDILYSDAMLENEATGSHPRVDLQTMLLPLFVDDTDRLFRERHDGILWFNHVYSDQKGATGIIGSASDAANFMLAYLNDGEWNGTQLLSAESIAMMNEEWHVAAGNTPESSPYESVSHGIGWFVINDGGRTYIGHRGGGPGFATGMRLYPDENMGTVMMSNGTYTPTVKLLDLVASLQW